MHRYVWLNTLTGEFSDSWDEEYLIKDLSCGTKYWKLIKYECVNDSSFKFNKNFKLR